MWTKPNEWIVGTFQNLDPLGSCVIVSYSLTLNSYSLLLASTLVLVLVQPYLPPSTRIASPNIWLTDVSSSSFRISQVSEATEYSRISVRWRRWPNLLRHSVTQRPPIRRTVLPYWQKKKNWNIYILGSAQSFCNDDTTVVLLCKRGSTEDVCF